MFKKIIGAGFASLILAFAGCSEVYAQINNGGGNTNVGAGCGINKAGTTISVIFGTTNCTAKQGTAIETVPSGGTGLATIPAHAVLFGNGTSNLTTLTPGTSGFVLTSQGAALDPVWQVAPSALVSSVFTQTGAIPNLSGDVTTSGTSATTLATVGTAGTYGMVTVNAKGLTTSGTVIEDVPHGGTGVASATLNGVLIGNGTSPMQATAVGSNNQVLTSNGGGSPPTFQAAQGGLTHNLNTVTTAQFDKSSDTTLANIPGLSINVVAGGTYQFDVVLYTTQPTAAQVAVSGTATATSFVALVRDDGGTLGVPKLSTSFNTAIATIGGSTTVGIHIYGTIVVNGAGTVTIQFAQNTATGTSSVLLNSTFHMMRIS